MPLIVKSFTESSLKSVMRRSDFKKDASGVFEPDRAELGRDALDWTMGDTRGRLAISSQLSKGRQVFKHSELAQELALRLSVRNLIAGAGLSFSNRNLVTRAVQSVLQGASAYTVIRLDVKEFYASFQHEPVRQKVLSDNARLGARTTSLISEFLLGLQDKGISGLAPGLPLSGVLAEYMMADFDSSARRHPEVDHYFRFVDDIFLLCSPDAIPQSVIADFKALLPPGLTLNTQKQSVLRLPKVGDRAASPISKTHFEYLGYSYQPESVAWNGSQRDKFKEDWRRVNVDIALAKVSKLKSRFVLSLLDYKRNPDIELLVARVRCLTENFNFSDQRTGKRRSSGIYYNYPILTDPLCGQLAKLDEFLHGVLFLGNGRLAVRMRRVLPMSARRKLAGFSFVRGHSSKRTQHLSVAQLSEIVGAWKHVE